MDKEIRGYAIQRKLPGRRYQYFVPEDTNTNSTDNWRHGVYEGHCFTAEADALTFIKNNRKLFDPDDKPSPVYKYDGDVCPNCAELTVRRDGVATSYPRTDVFLCCTTCNHKWVDKYYIDVPRQPIT